MRTFVLVMAMVLFLLPAGCTSEATPQDEPALVAPTTGGNPPSSRPVAARAEDVQPVSVGEPAPAPVLSSAEGTPVDLAEVYADGPTMLIFYRGSWCPYCNRHVSEVAQAEGALRQMGVKVVALSVDRPEVIAHHLADQPDLTYTLLSDADAEAARAFGLAFRVDDETIERYHGYGIDLEAASGRDHHILPVPAVYLIDTTGVVRFAFWDADYTKRLSGDEMIEAARTMPSS